MRRFPVAQLLLQARSTLAARVRERREERFAARASEKEQEEAEARAERMRIQALTGLPMNATEIQLEVEENQRRLRRFGRGK